MRARTKIKVRIFLGDKEIEASEVPNLIIKSDYVDKLVNTVFERNDCVLDTNETA